MLLFRDIELSSKLDFCDMSVGSDYFLELQYLEQGTFFLAETFKIFSEPLNLSTREISGQNSFI